MATAAEQSPSKPEAANSKQQPDETFEKPTPNYLQSWMQKSPAPTMRAPVPEHIREQFRSRSPLQRPSTPKPLPASHPPQSPSASPHAFRYLPNTADQDLRPVGYNSSPQGRTPPQDSIMGNSRRHHIDHEAALGELSRTIHHEYSRPVQASTDYTQPQVREPGYGRPSPFIPPVKANNVGAVFQSPLNQRWSQASHF